LDTHEKQFLQHVKAYRDLVFLEEGELEPQIALLTNIMDTINFLGQFNPAHLRKLAHYQKIHSEKLELLALQASYHPVVVEGASGVRRLSPREILKKEPVDEILTQAKESLKILQMVLNDKPLKVKTVVETQKLAISPQFKCKFYEVVELIDSLHENIFLLEEFKLYKTQQVTLQHLIRNSSLLQKSIKDFMNEYFETMVLCNDLSEFNRVQSFIDEVKPAIINHLLRHQATDVLIFLIKKLNLSIFGELFQNAPKSIFDHIIHHEYDVCFAAILEQFSIDFLQELPDGRPLALLVLDLNPANQIRMRCFSDTAQFNSKVFFQRLKRRIEELLEIEHPQRGKLLEVYSTIDVYTEHNGSRSLESSRLMQKVSDSHHSFFAGFASQLQEKDFLKQERFLRLIQKYDELSRKQFERAKATRKITQHVQAHNVFLEHFCSDETRRRLEGLIPKLTEEEAYEALNAAYEVAEAYDRIIDIELELQKRATFSAKKYRALAYEKAELEARVQQLRHGAKESKRMLVLNLANQKVMIEMTPQEQEEAAIILTKNIDEKPIEFYASLEGILPVHLDLMQQVKALLDVRAIGPAIDCLDRLMEQLNISNPPQETVSHLSEFVLLSTQKMFRQ
jgi:hypothetical protein